MSRTTWLAIAAAYLALIASVIWGMFVYRRAVLISFDTPEARADWQQWREASARQSSAGPVRRRPIQSAEPPTEVMARDYFIPLLSGAIFFSSLFYWLFLWILRGAATTKVVPAVDNRAPRG